MFFDTSEKAIQLLDLRKYKIELEIFNIINLIVVAFFIIIFLMQHVHAIVAIFTKKKKWDEAKIEHNFGVLICGRNEENVISKLIFHQITIRINYMFLFVQIIVRIILLLLQEKLEQLFMNALIMN